MVYCVPPVDIVPAGDFVVNAAVVTGPVPDVAAAAVVTEGACVVVVLITPVDPIVVWDICSVVAWLVAVEPATVADVYVVFIVVIGAVVIVGAAVVEPIHKIFVYVAAYGATVAE